LQKKAYEFYAQEQEKLLKTTCIQNNIEILEMMTDKPFVPTLAGFLKSRIKHKTRISK